MDSRVFIGIQWTLIFVQAVAMYLIEDEPEDVAVQKQRMEFIHAKIVERVEDEDYGEENEDGISQTGADGALLLLSSLLSSLPHPHFLTSSLSASRRRGCEWGGERVSRLLPRGQPTREEADRAGEEHPPRRACGGGERLPAPETHGAGDGEHLRGRRCRVRLVAAAAANPPRGEDLAP